MLPTTRNAVRELIEVVKVLVAFGSHLLVESSGAQRSMLGSCPEGWRQILVWIAYNVLTVHANRLATWRGSIGTSGSGRT